MLDESVTADLEQHYGFLARHTFMKIIFAVVLVVHGLIHLMGTLKAFGFAEIPQLTQQIDRPRGVLWLLAAVLLLATALSLLTWPHWCQCSRRFAGRDRHVVG
jgi:hypothetical protein